MDSAGALYEEHWSLVPPTAATPPVAEIRQEWPRLGIDYFVLAKMVKKGLEPQADAIPRTLVRRVSVATQEDFGSQGAGPSHPELLDWLAVNLRDKHRWSIKRFCKSLVMSSTFRQDSTTNALKRETDPGNVLLSHGPRYRLPSEVVRDQVLVVAGTLSRKMYGPPVMPLQPEGAWRSTYSNLKWHTSEGEDSRQRAIYTFWKRTSPYPSALLFDSESREVCAPRRIRTNTPLQSLVLMNDPVFVQAAGGLAAQMLKKESLSEAEMLAFAFCRVLVREPSSLEIKRFVRLLQQAQAHFAKQPEAAASLLEAAAVPIDDGNRAKAAAAVVAASTLLNLDETVTLN